MPALRDPAARPRLVSLLVALVVLGPLFRQAGFGPALLDGSIGFGAMGGFLAAFWPPEHGPEFMHLLLRATLETLAMATVGVFLAVLLALPLGLAVTHSLSIARIGPAPRRWPGRVLRSLARVVLLILRGVPELVWALLFVRIFGLGAAAGVLALALTYGGMLGKVYSEILESTERAPLDALLAAGSGRLAALGYGLLPNAAAELLSYTVYRWECAVRASVVMGFVGAGGLGQLMDQSMKMLNGAEAASILATFLLLVLCADGLSALLRRRLA